MVDFESIDKIKTDINNRDYLTVKDLALLIGVSDVTVRTHIGRPEFERYRLLGSMRPLRFKKSQKLIQDFRNYLSTRERANGYV